MTIDFTIRPIKKGMFELLALDLDTYQVHAKYSISDTKRGYKVTAFDGEQWTSDDLVRATNECIRDCKEKKGWK